MWETTSDASPAPTYVHPKFLCTYVCMSYVPHYVVNLSIANVVSRFEESFAIAVDKTYRCILLV